MSLVIQHQITLQWQDSKPWLVPQNLLVVEGDQTFLKISPIHHSLIALICNGMKIDKNGRISNSPALERMKQMRNQASESTSAADEPFQSEGSNVKKKARVTQKEEKPNVITIMVDDTPVQVIRTKSRASEDLCVLMEASSLEAVFGAVRAEPGFQTKRSYKQKTHEETSSQPEQSEEE